MAVNKNAIYNTEPLAPYKEGNICMTQQPYGNAFFYYLAKEGETRMPATITIESHQPAEGAQVRLLGVDEPLKWKVKGNGFEIIIPKKLQETPPCQYVWTFGVSALKQ
jgi:alpha-L-fucosidase